MARAPHDGTNHHGLAILHPAQKVSCLLEVSITCLAGHFGVVDTRLPISHPECVKFGLLPSSSGRSSCKRLSSSTSIGEIPRGVRKHHAARPAFQGHARGPPVERLPTRTVAVTLLSDCQKSAFCTQSEHCQSQQSGQARTCSFSKPASIFPHLSPQCCVPDVSSPQ